MTENILVTGGAGFIGIPLVERLATFANVIVVDSLEPQVHRSTTFPARLEAVARCIRAEVGDVKAYRDVLDDVDVIVHLASQTGTGQSMYDLSRYVSHNALGTAQLLEAVTIAATKPRRIVLASSRAVYGDGVYDDGSRFPVARRNLKDLLNGNWEPVNSSGSVVRTMPMHESHPAEPTSVYGMTKLWQEQLVRSVCAAQGMDFAILRFQNVFGPGQSLDNPYTGIIGHFTLRLAAEQAIELFEDGRMTRDFIFIDDVVRAIETVISHAEPLGDIYNVGTGVSTTLDELIRTIGLISARTPRVEYSGRFRAGDVRHAVADTGRFAATFGEQLRTPLNVGLKEYFRWFVTQGDNTFDRHAKALEELQQRGLFYRANLSREPT